MAAWERGEDFGWYGVGIEVVAAAGHDGDGRGDLGSVARRRVLHDVAEGVADDVAAARSEALDHDGDVVGEVG